MTARSPNLLDALPDGAVIFALEAGRLIGRNCETLRRWRRAGTGPAWLAHPVRHDAAEYRLGDLRRWLAKRAKAPHATVEVNIGGPRKADA